MRKKELHLVSRILASCAALLLAVGAWAGDPWKDKPFTDWDEKDVRRILGDSPWTRVARVEAFWVTTDPSAGAGGAGGAAGRSAADSGYSTGERVTASERAQAAPAGADRAPEAVFLIQWASAKTIRLALGRSAILRGAATQADVEQSASSELPDYQVAILGQDMTPFAQATEAALKDKAHIRAKKSGQRTSPSRVVIQRAGDGKRVVAVIFFFPKTSEAGEPVIAPAEKSVEFYCDLGKVALRSSFEPQKMVSKQGVDL